MKKMLSRKKQKVDQKVIQQNMRKLPWSLESFISRLIPSQNVEKWEKVSNCGYFLRNALPYTAEHLSRSKSAFNALKHSVVQSLTIFQQRVLGLRIYGEGRRIPYLQHLPCWSAKNHCQTPIKDDVKVFIGFVDVFPFSDITSKVKDKDRALQDNIKSTKGLISLCRKITEWKNELRTIDTQIMLFFDIVDRFHRTQNVAEFEAAVSQANMRMSVHDARFLMGWKQYEQYKIDALHDNQYLSEVVLRPIEIEMNS